MVTADQIIEHVHRIAETFQPRRIVLFGSYANGVATEDSDVDLLITKRRWSTSPLTAAGLIRIKLGVPFAMDLLVRSESDIARRIDEKDSFVLEIIEKGITLFAADDERVGRQGRIRLRRRMRGPSVTQEIEAR